VNCNSPNYTENRSGNREIRIASKVTCSKAVVTTVIRLRLDDHSTAVRLFVKVAVTSHVSGPLTR